jgi:hypothetical protein
VFLEAPSPDVTYAKEEIGHGDAMNNTRLVPFVLLLLLGSASKAASPEASGAVVINGKTFSLQHGRAWRNGESMGVPGLSVILAEKPLAGLDWWKGDGNFGEGQRGVALRIDPSADPKNERGKEPYRYAVAEDYEIQLHAGDYRGWNAATLTAAMPVEEITIAGGWVRGRIEWKGELPNPFDSEQILTAYSATFHLPLEEIGPQPAN